MKSQCGCLRFYAEFLYAFHEAPTLSHLRAELPDDRRCKDETSFLQTKFRKNKKTCSATMRCCRNPPELLWINRLEIFPFKKKFDCQLMSKLLNSFNCPYLFIFFHSQYFRQSDSLDPEGKSSSIGACWEQIIWSKMCGCWIYRSPIIWCTIEDGIIPREEGGVRRFRVCENRLVVVRGL